MAYISRFKEEFDSAEYLGKGGYGVVMKARNKLDGQYYAIKRVKLPSSQAGRDKKLKEAVALATLVHTNIVRYYSTWQETPPPGFQEAEDETIIPAHISSLPSASDSIQFEAGTSSTSTSESGSFITFEPGPPSPGSSDAPLEISTSLTEGSSSEEHITNESSMSEEEETRSTTPATYLYIQMELCKKTLATWLQENPERLVATCVDIIRQIDTGLQHVHALGFIHRDLCPANIFFSLDNVVKIGDFGLVTSITDKSKEMAGRTLYRSQEQLEGRACDSTTDIFALGIILFELLYPMGTSMERITVLPEVKKGNFPGDFDGWKVDLVRRLVDADPKNRPDATEVLSLLPTNSALNEQQHAGWADGISAETTLSSHRSLAPLRGTGFFRSHDGETIPNQVELQKARTRIPSSVDLTTFSIVSKAIDLIVHFGRSVCKIESRHGTASGFLLEGRYIITCAHILDRHQIHANQRCVVTFNVSDEHEHKFHTTDAGPLVKNENLDYMILELDSDPDPTLIPPLGPYVPDDDVLDIRESTRRLVVIGHPVGGQKQLDFAHTIPAYDTNKSHLTSYKTDSMYHGTSGSPVFDEHGCPVAIHSRGFFASQDGPSVIEQGVNLSSIKADVKRLCPALFNKCFPGQNEQIVRPRQYSLPTFNTEQAMCPLAL